MLGYVLVEVLITCSFFFYSAGGKSELADVIIVKTATPPPQRKHGRFFEVLHKPVDANTDIERGVRESLPREDPSSQGI